jgi:hypothetical protein
VFGACGDGVMERDWSDIYVKLEVSGPLKSCFGKAEEEKDEADAHGYGEEVEGPLPAQ